MIFSNLVTWANLSTQMKLNIDLEKEGKKNECKGHWATVLDYWNTIKGPTICRRPSVRIGVASTPGSEHLTLLILSVDLFTLRLPFPS